MCKTLIESLISFEINLLYMVFIFGVTYYLKIRKL